MFASVSWVFTVIESLYGVLFFSPGYFKFSQYLYEYIQMIPRVLGKFIALFLPHSSYPEINSKPKWGSSH